MSYENTDAGEVAVEKATQLSFQDREIQDRHGNGLQNKEDISSTACFTLMYSH